MKNNLRRHRKDCLKFPKESKSDKYYIAVLTVVSKSFDSKRLNARYESAMRVQ